MPYFHVDIDGRVYEGFYRTQANAVFGAMRKDENEYDKGMRRYDTEGKMIGVEQIVGRKPATKKVKRVR